MSLKQRIEAQAPLRLDHYIEACLWDAEEGYYRRADVFGAQGDFTTSPEISQIFGEVIGIWALQAWSELGKPRAFALLEMGAGRGVLMRDLLRVAELDPAFMAAMQLHILEKSPARRAEQSAAIKHEITFLDDLTLPDLPLIAFSNEFFDALPIRQFRNEGGGWLEAYVSDLCAKIWQPCPRPPAPIAKFLNHDSIIEWNAAMVEIGKTLAQHLRSFSGQMLTIDYGDFDGTGDTLQALRAQKMVDPFEAPGTADLTAHIRFLDLAEAMELPCDFMTQAQFLNAYGGAQRLQSLARQNPALAQDLNSGYDRLTSEKQMGQLFKALIQKATR